MGVWVQARRPTRKRPDHFEATVPWWTPFWEFTLDVAEDVVPEDVAYDGFLGNGAYIRVPWARTIADRLDEALEGGRVADRVEKRDDHLFSAETVRNFRDFCRNSGGFWVT
jgi:hypothetical protein